MAADTPRLPSRFALLWFGQGTSELGSAVSALALPLVAALALNAGPAELGWLGAAVILPWLTALPIGVWIDRRPTRPVLIAADLARAAATCLIPIAWHFGFLTLPLLYAIAAVLGLGQVFFDTAWGSALPRLVGSGALVQAHSRLEATRSATGIAGPGLAGLLIRGVGAAPALFLDAASFLVSAFSVARAVPRQETAPAASHESMATAVKAGLAVVWRQPVLRALVSQAAIWNAVNGATNALFVLYALQVLDLDSGGIGVLFMIGGAGAVVGAAAVPVLLRRFAFGPLYLTMVTAACAGFVLLGGTLPLVAVGQLLIGLGIAVTRVQAVSLRQTVTPVHLLGRTLATYRLLAFAAIPLGSVLGGLAGARFGLRPALLACAGMAFTALLPLLFSPVRSLRTLPKITEEGN
ncbi:MFS transporter [Hamadaea sp. NPDC050747]|uniref:MFS transporter n=1 Tax=Hamadaea sp. NPDC050747 TaxID=3155789 RepID=UPI00340FBE35